MPGKTAEFPWFSLLDFLCAPGSVRRGLTWVALAGRPGGRGADRPFEWSKVASGVPWFYAGGSHRIPHVFPYQILRRAPGSIRGDRLGSDWPGGQVAEGPIAVGKLPRGRSPRESCHGVNCHGGCDGQRSSAVGSRWSDVIGVGWLLASPLSTPLGLWGSER